MIRETTDLLGTLVSLQPVVSSKGGESNEDKVLAIAADMEEKMPPVIDLEAAELISLKRITYSGAYTPMDVMPIWPMPIG